MTKISKSRHQRQFEIMKNAFSRWRIAPHLRNVILQISSKMIATSNQTSSSRRCRRRRRSCSRSLKKGKLDRPWQIKKGKSWKIWELQKATSCTCLNLNRCQCNNLIRICISHSRWCRRMDKLFLMLNHSTQPNPSNPVLHYMTHSRFATNLLSSLVWKDWKRRRRNQSLHQTSDCSTHLWSKDIFNISI